MYRAKTIPMIALVVCFKATTVYAQAVKHLECQYISITVSIPNLQKIRMGKSEIEEMYQSFPRDCRTDAYRYGNGVIDYVPHSNRCSRAFSKLGLPPEAIGYPREYRSSNKKMTWNWSGKILDPSVGTTRVNYQNKLDQETMILTQKVTTTTDGKNATAILLSVCEQINAKNRLKRSGEESSNPHYKKVFKLPQGHPDSDKNN